MYTWSPGVGAWGRVGRESTEEILVCADLLMLLELLSRPPLVGLPAVVRVRCCAVRFAAVAGQDAVVAAFLVHLV